MPKNKGKGLKHTKNITGNIEMKLRITKQNK